MLTSTLGFVAEEKRLFVDPQRCIGCRACVQACSECPDHGGDSMIHLDQVDSATSVQTVPTVCMHCDDPACATACPTHAIRKGEDGVVHTAMVERCIGCTNCVVACPFGVPKYDASRDLMMKCDLCYDRTSRDLKPMCATVCPSEALYYGTADEIAERRRGRAVSDFWFGGQQVTTRNALVTPLSVDIVQIADAGADAHSTAQECLEEAIL